MQKKKGIALVLSFALVACLAVAGVLAYLTAKSETVTNTFTIGNIKITLDESEATYKEGTWVLDEQKRVQANTYENVYPGAEIAKDPVVTIEKGSEACWLFVTVSPDAGKHALLDYAIDSKVWTALGEDYPGVYYCSVELATANAGETYNVLADQEVTVKKTANDASKFDNIVFNAYAVQSAGLDDVFDAWDQVKPAAQA